MHIFIQFIQNKRNLEGKKSIFFSSKLKNKEIYAFIFVIILKSEKILKKKMHKQFKKVGKINDLYYANHCKKNWHQNVEQVRE